MNNVFAMPVASPAFVTLFAATVATFFPDNSIRVESAPDAQRVLRKHPEATFIEPGCWEPARPKHYLCLIAPLSWQQLDKQIFLEPQFMHTLVSQFGSAAIGAAGSEENQYLYLSAEILALIGATHQLHAAFLRQPTPSNLKKTLQRLESSDGGRRHVYEDVLGLDQGTYHRHLSEFCSDLVDGVPR